MISLWLSNLSMQTIEDVRHANFLALIERYGGIQPLSNLLDRTHSQLSQWKTRAKHSRTGKPRNIGSDTCRYIEKTLGLPDNWMDSPHVRSDAVDINDARQTSVTGWPFKTVSYSRFDLLPKEAQAEIDSILGFHVSQWESKLARDRKQASAR